MYPTTQPAQFAKPLADKAMLVRFKVRRQAHSVRDDAATSYVESQFGVTSAGQFNKKLFKGSARYAALNTALNEVATYHRENTLPWLDGGFRVLPNERYMEYTQKMQQLTREVEVAAAAFSDNWYNEVQADINRLGNMANAADYDCRQDVGVEVRLMPLPHDSDFRVQVSDADRAAFNAALSEVNDLAAHELKARLLDPLQRLTDKLKVYKGEKGQRFHTDMVTSIGDQLEMVRSLNINDDTDVEALCRDVERELNHYIGDPTLLKDSQYSRTYVSTKLDSILAGFGDFTE